MAASWTRIRPEPPEANLALCAGAPRGTRTPIMCTLVVLSRPGHAWPLLLAGNRDESTRRPWRPPGRHWPDRPQVLAGLDLLGGGTWMGVNDAGLVALVMNRHGTLGPAPGKRSRGELVLAALDWATTAAAMDALATQDLELYRPFNLVLADAGGAYWIAHRGGVRVRAQTIPPGAHLLSAWDLDDLRDARVRCHLPQLGRARAPDPAEGDWEDWIGLLADRRVPPGAGPTTAMNFALEEGFGTLCSFLLALPAPDRSPSLRRLLFAAGPPHQTPFLPLDWAPRP